MKRCAPTAGPRSASAVWAVVFLSVTGPDDDEDGPETFRPAPHPDDRLWRHPSEIAAMHAAQANADTAKLPAVRIDGEPSRGKLHVGMMVAAGVVVVGAAALTLGVLSGQRVSNSPGADDEIAAASLPVSNPTSAGTDFAGQMAVEVNAESDGAMTSRVHDEVAASLPRIQAVVPGGMREGSGLFITDDGYIATSAGLIENAEYVLAWTDDGQRWKAEVVALDPISDVAVVHIDSDDWPAASLGVGDPWDGQQALALDHDDRTISIGEVTSVSAPLVEIDQPAALPGSAIVDGGGEVIAMVTADGTNRHATPAWMIEQVAVDLIATGATVHVWLGLAVEDHPSGDMVVVDSVLDGSPAQEAGLRPGDLIDSVNGHAIDDAASLYRHIQNSEPGDEAVLTVTRNASRRIVVTTLIEQIEQPG